MYRGFHKNIKHHLLLSMLKKCFFRVLHNIIVLLYFWSTKCCFGAHDLFYLFLPTPNFWTDMYIQISNRKLFWYLTFGS